MPILSNLPAVVAAAVGVLIAFTAYRRSTIKRQTHDLGAELRAERELLRASIAALSAQIDLAKRSRTRTIHTPEKTDGLQQWQCELELDLSELELLRSQLLTIDSSDIILSELDTELQLVEILALSLRANALAEKYRASFPARGTDRQTFADDGEAAALPLRATFADEGDAEALRRKASQYSDHDSRRSIAESVV